MSASSTISSSPPREQALRRSKAPRLRFNPDRKTNKTEVSQLKPKEKAATQTQPTPVAATGQSICSNYASIRPGSSEKGVTLTELYKPKTNVPQQVRYYLLNGPGSCENGQCWRCLQSPQKGYYKGSQIESCSSTGKFNPSDKKGNMINWKIVPSGRGPEGIQLYNMLSVDGMKKANSDDYEVVFENVAFARIKIDDSPDTFMIKRFREKNANLQSLVVFQPCTGKIMMNDIEHDKAGGKNGIQLYSKKLSELNGPVAQFWSIRDPAEINEKDRNFPIDV